jgi:cation diffusion facilitator CzcD-associated flavoprotein CzcO
MKQVDFLIIGAGLAGIGAAVHFQKQYPNKTFAIVEKRGSIGGTWDVFKYPGVRSDSDMFTLGYSFKPWTGSYYATGQEINNYIKETAQEYNITQHIHFNTTASGLEWQDNQWTLYTNNDMFVAKFVLFATGYINHERSHFPFIKNHNSFKGKIIHTQYWDSDIDYTDKKIVVIGSGATAYTLVPELAKTAKHVTMIQRSPSYVRSEERNPEWLKDIRKELSDPQEIHDKVRLYSTHIQHNQFHNSRQRPEVMKRLLINDVKKQLDPTVDIKHFTPNYMPWDQRICKIIDNDFIQTVNSGTVSIETDTIESFTVNTVVLSSGKEVEADIIVMATGFKTRMMGDISIKVDDVDKDYTKLKAYKGTMIEDLPNLGYIFGYASMSWTLKLELALSFYSRVFDYMDKNNYSVFVPFDENTVESGTGFIDLSANFYTRSEDKFPRQGVELPWQNTNNIVVDKTMLLEDPIDDGVLKFK